MPPEPARPTCRPVRTVPLPLSAQHWAVLSAQFPLTPDEWGQMLTTLETMRPALVDYDDAATVPAAPGELP